MPNQFSYAERLTLNHGCMDNSWVGIFKDSEGFPVYNVKIGTLKNSIQGTVEEVFYTDVNGFVTIPASSYSNFIKFSGKFFDQQRIKLDCVVLEDGSIKTTPSNIISKPTTSTPDVILSLEEKGKQLMSEEKYFESTKYFKRILEIDPDNTDALFLMATAENKEGLRYAADRTFQKILEIDPNNVDAKLEREKIGIVDEKMSFGSSGNRILEYAVVGMIFGAILFANGFRSIKRKKLMESIPTSKIRSLAVGIAEIYGKATTTERLIRGPFSNEECIVCRVVIQEYERWSKYRRWHTVKDIILFTKFMVEDETGKVQVEPRQATLDIPVSFKNSSGWGSDPPNHTIEFLKKNNLNFEGFLGMNKSLRYLEYSIKPGDNIYVLGRADDNPYIKDGSAQEGAIDIMMQKSHNPNIYYISNKSEKQILGKLSTTIIGQIIGGPLVIGGCLLVILLKITGVF